MSDAKKPMNCPKNKWILVTICSAGNEVFRCKYVQEGIKKEENNENKEDDIFAQKARLAPDHKAVWGDPIQLSPLKYNPPLLQRGFKRAPDHHQEFAPKTHFWDGGASFYVFNQRVNGYEFRELLARKCVLAVCLTQTVNWAYTSEKADGFAYKEIGKPSILAKIK